MTRTEMNMLTERFAEVTGKQNDSVMNSARCAEYLGISQGAYPHNQKQGSQICDMECDRISYLKKQLACISADK